MFKIYIISLRRNQKGYSLQATELIHKGTRHEDGMASNSFVMKKKIDKQDLSRFHIQ